MSRASTRNATVHRCHLRGCKTVTSPRMLFCKPHWAEVPGMLQRPVLFTVNKRGPNVDATWAPWWKAQAAAQAFLLRKHYPELEEYIRKYEDKEAAFVAYLERKGS